jgi:RNA polymerase sigma factor (sigma-70 family)
MWRLTATWQGGNKDEPSAKVTRRAKSYGQLVRAARPVDADGKPRPVWDPKYNYEWRADAKLKAEKYGQRGEADWRTYSDIRRHGKTRCEPDATYAQAAQRELETFLHYAIDEVAPKRRRQVRRQRETRLWQQERCRRQPRRLLYLLKQPQTWLEVQILMEVVGWFLTQHETTEFVRDLSAGKPVNCVSDGALESSKENDSRTPKLRRHVLPTKTEELDLVGRAKKGDPIARDRLLSTHWPLVHLIAKNHATTAHPLFDLIQEGFIRLTECFEDFDPKKGFRFSTFAMRPLEWAILDYKRREQKKDTPLDAAMVANFVDLGNHGDSVAGTARTSRSVRNRIARGNITVHISPYANGMAPETHDFIAELNAEAERLNAGVQFLGLANRIEVTGDVEGAASSATLVGWFLSRAQKVGFFEGEEGVLRRGNSKVRKEIRKRAKRKPK